MNVDHCFDASGNVSVQGFSVQISGGMILPALSDYGGKAAAILVTLRNSILRPIAGKIFDRPPKLSLKTNSKLQAQYRRTTKSFNDLIALLKAA